MCRVPDKDDPKYKDDEEAYEDDLEEMQEKTDALKPKDFPYTFYLMDAAQEKAFDDPIFATYRGPVYWNDCGRDFIVDPNQPKENFQPENMANLVYSSLTPLKVFSGGEKPLTPRTIEERQENQKEESVLKGSSSLCTKHSSSPAHLLAVGITIPCNCVFVSYVDYARITTTE